jgi:hypothetical protein
MTTTKKKAAKPKKAPLETDVRLKDGTPIGNLSPKKKVLVLTEHLDEDHPDYNPQGRTVTAMNLRGTAAPLDAMLKADEEKERNLDKGRPAGLAASKKNAAERQKLFRDRAEHLLREHPRMNRTAVIEQVFDFYDMNPEYKNKLGFSKETIRDYFVKIWDSLVPQKKV